MGKQLGFMLDRKDEKRFLNYALERGELYSDEEKFEEGKIYEVSDEFINYNWFQVFISAKDEMKVTFEELSNGRKYISSVSEPVIEFSRTVIKNKTIMRGRLWLEMKYYDDKGELKTKSKELDELYRDLCKWIRKNLKKVTIEDRGFVWKGYASDSMDELMKEGYTWIQFG